MEDKELDEHWFVWSPARAENVAYADIARAVEEFEPLDYPAGHAATAWLKEEALTNHPFTLTYLYVLDGRLEGFFAICSASVTLHQSHRKKLAPDARLAPTQGASLIVWLAKHRDATIDGEAILDVAESMALAAAQRQGAVALVLDPFDDDTASLWTNKYGFRRSRTEVRQGSQHRLWHPLHTS